MMHLLPSRALHRSVCSTLLGIAFLVSGVQAQPQTHQANRLYDLSDRIFHPVHATGGIVSSEHALASRAGADMLERGGNAVDAAVATALALAVVLPNAGNLGGGGFMLIRRSADTETLAIDFRETAPKGATRDMFLDPTGEVVKGKNTLTPYSVATPGSVAGLMLAHELAGSLPRDVVMQPAITLAESGFEVTYTLARLLESHHAYLGRWPSSRAIFFTKIDASEACEMMSCPLDRLRTWQEGERLIQSELAWSLRQIAASGASAFYDGEVGQRLAKALDRDPGAMTLDDLKAYRPVIRPVVKGQYRGVEIHSMPPPSSGGVHLIQMLNMLEGLPVKDSGYGSAASIHLLAEVARLAYADRAAFLGDTDFVRVPLNGLLSKDYATSRAKEINLDRATSSQSVREGHPLPAEGDQTTHLSVVDPAGNMVSLTTTLNLNFGMGMVAAGTGILLNNEMDDFSAKPGVPNAFGLIGSEANQIEPHKRPLSSMTPVIALKDGKPWIATGTPGGARIITTVLQQLVNIIDHEMNIAEAMSMPRMHHQWFPDQIRLEKGFSPDTVKLLESKGHQIRILPAMGSLQTVSRDGDGQVWGASDPRRIDGASIGVMKKQ